MAAPAGDGSFRTVPMGFDKNEVNAYIDKYRQRIQEAEMFKKTCEDRISTAEKAAEAAKKEVEEVKKQLMASSTEFEVRLKTERRNSDLLTNQIDELKRKLKNAGSARGASTAEAEKKSAEIINAANAQARDIVERAKKSAQDIISSAKGSVGGSGGAVSEEFIAEARKFVEIVNSGFKAVAAQAVALGTDAPATSVEMPDFSKIQAPQASVPTPTTTPAPVSTPAPAVNPQEVFAGISTETDNGDMFSFGDIPDNSASEPITEVQPLNPMAEDMFNMDSMGGVGAVEEISPISENETVGFDENFTAALLAQSSAVTEPEPVGGSFGAEPPAADNPWASLQAEFNSLGNDSSAGIGGFDSGEVAPADNPWASLQAEFSSMGGGMDMGGFDGSDSTDLSESYNDDPQVPNTDDSSLWDFGGSNTGDDDMSSDLFGGF
ncbi:MAG: DivIVA domain-containing protein [Oscillospiraceae bacterium]|nr:DivIVA domain-containing protein [Oscillospiraceae bacterium]